MSDFQTGLFYERATLGVENSPVTDFARPFVENIVADLKVSELRAIYPLIKAINSGRLTRNFTLYPAESLMGKNKPGDPTGYSSFVLPYGKPILQEHRAQDSMGMFGGGTQASPPMGRVIYSGFRRRKKEEGVGTLPPKKNYPGTVEGDGCLLAVPVISHEWAIKQVLGGAFHTVSIGSQVEKIVESISGEDLIALYKSGKELPDYQKGQEYKGQLSYWTMGEIRGKEISFVNMPSDEMAGVTDPDIGKEGIRLLMGEKKMGRKEYAFYDTKTLEMVDLSDIDQVWDESYDFVDSVAVGGNIHFTTNSLESYTPAPVTPQVEEEPMKKEDIIALLKDLKKLNEAYEEWKSDTEKEAFLEPILAQLKEQVTEFKDLEVPGGFESLYKKFTTSEALDVEATNPELFLACQESALSLFSDTVDEKSMGLALVSYLLNEGAFNAIVNEDAPLTVGVLYNIEDTEIASLEAKLSTKKRDSLADSTFCGPNRSFPVPDRAHAIAALRLLGRYKGGDKEKIRACILRKGKKWGVGAKADDKNSDTLVLYPLHIELDEEKSHCPIVVSSKEDAATLLETLDVAKQAYDLTDEQCENIKNFISQFEGINFDLTDLTAPLYDKEYNVDPISLDKEFLLNYFINKETETNYLSSLVGLAKKLNLDKKSISEATGPYKMYGNKVLELIWKTLPETAVVAPEPTDPVEIHPNPVVVESEPEGTTSTKSQSLVDTMCKPRRKALNSKEKK